MRIINLLYSFQRYIFYYKITPIMGNTHENAISPTLLEFEIVRTHPLGYYKQIKHKKTCQTLLVKQIIPMDENDSYNIQSIIEAKTHNKSTFVTQLVYWEKPVSTQFCSKSQSYLLLFNNVGITLTEYIKSSRRTKIPFQPDKLSNILQEVLKGLKYFNSVHHLHKQISPDCIFYDGYKAILMDPWLTSKHNISIEAMKLHRQVRKNIYKSPEKLLYQRDEIQSYDFLKSNVYELGLLIMDLATDGKYTEQFDQNYDKKHSVSKQKIRKVNIGVLLEGIQDFQLKSKLNVLLNPNPDKRLTIFNIMLPQRITLKEFNPVNKNTNFKNLPHNRFNSEFTQNSVKKWPKSLKKVREGQKNTSSKSKSKEMGLNLNLNSLKILSTNNHTPQKSEIYKYQSLANSPRTEQISKKLEKQRNRSASSTPRGSIFTYAQWLPNYTQSNETAFLQKKSQKQTHPNSLYHHPHKILKNIESHKTSPNNSFVKQTQQSSRNFNHSYQDHLSPKESFINQLHYTSKNNGDHNLNTIEEQMNSYITSGVKIESIPLSRQDSNIKLSENQSNKNLLPSRANNFNRNNNNRCHYQASPQIRPQSKSNISVRFHICNPSPQKPVYNHPQYLNNMRGLQPPKLSPGINFFSTPKQYYNTSANVFSNTNHTNEQKYDLINKQKQLNSPSNKIVLQKKQSKQSKSSKSSQSSPSTPSFHRRLFSEAHSTQEPEEKGNFSKNVQGKRIIKQIKMGDIGMVKKTKTIESMEEDSQSEYQIKQVQQEYESSRSYHRKQPIEQQLIKHMAQKEKEKVNENENEKQQEKEKDRSRQSSKVSKSSSKNRLSYIKISTPDKKKSIQEYSVNFTQSNQEDSGEDRDKDNNVTSDKCHQSEKAKQCKKQQKGSQRNEYTSDLDSAKEAQSIIFDSESKTNVKKQFSKIRKKDHHSLENSFDHNSLNKNISFGPQQATAKQKNMNQKVKDKIINKTDIRPTQQSDFIKKIISMTNSKIPDKDSQQLSLFEANTAKKSESKKHTLYNAGGKLTLSIQTSPLASIQSVVDNNYNSSLFGNLKKREKSNNSSPYLKNLKKDSRQDYGKIQQVVIGEQLGYSQQYDIVGLNKKFLSKNKGFKRANDVIEQHLRTENTLINQLDELRSGKLQQNQYNAESNQSLKYYVIEKYPLSSNNQLIEKYEGYKCNGLRHGFGTYYYANGDIYHGEWKNDKHHGQGGIYRQKKKQNNLGIDQMSLVTKSIIHHKQQYDIICEGLWENDQFVPNIDTNSNNSNKNSSIPVSPPSSPNIFSKSSPEKYKTSLVNLLPIPSKICSSFQAQLHPTKKSLGEEISFVTSQNFQSGSSCSIGKKQKMPEFNPLTQIITLKNGDLFKGKSISNKGPNNQMTINGKLIKKNGQIVEGTWIYRENQLFEIK